MGMFDIIDAKLECPKTKKIEKREIQIKWREPRLLDHFKIRDSIEGIVSEYDNNWVRADYLCGSCSKITQGRLGYYIKTDDQKWHYCFVKMKNSQIKSVLSKKEFDKLGIDKYVIYD